jgi:prepilin-type N-terminal cleavage/methylation domain-containing protein
MITSVTCAVRRRLTAVARTDAGFSLIEVVVSFVLFSIVAGGATYGIVSSLKASHTSQQRIDAANVAQSFIASTENSTSLVQVETARQFTATVGTPSGATPNLGTELFLVQRWITFSASGETQCSPGSTFTVNVTVSQKSTGTFLARSDSVIAC